MWIELLQTVAIVGPFLVSGYSVHVNTRVIKFNIEHEIARSHRELFLELVRDEELARVLNTST